MGLDTLLTILSSLAIILGGAWFLWTQIYSIKSDMNALSDKLHERINTEKNRRLEKVSMLDRQIGIFEERIRHLPSEEDIERIVSRNITPLETRLKLILDQMDSKPQIQKGAEQYDSGNQKQ